MTKVAESITTTQNKVYDRSMTSMYVHLNSIYCFFIIYVGYIVNSLLLNYFYYYKRSNDRNSWKIQSNKGIKLEKPAVWGVPYVSNKQERDKYHTLFTTFNLINASLFALIVCELTMRGYSSMRFDTIATYTYVQLIVDTICAIIYQCVLEYYWHRLMHVPYFYKALHKYHHHYKSPEIFDDMYIHPLEAVGYYTILYSPTLVLNIHIYSFIIYMILMGVCGVLDHSGIKIKIPYIYNTEDHDKHHEMFNCNYAFPFIFMDLLHNTYYVHS